MPLNRSVYPFLLFALAIAMLYSCGNRESSAAPSEIVRSPEEIRSAATDLIEEALKGDEAIIINSISLGYSNETRALYEPGSFAPLWSDRLMWLPAAESLYSVISTSKLFGLFPEDYHFNEITEIRNRFLQDTLIRHDRRDAALWSKADILFTDGFVSLLRDVKLGRLPVDSITLRKDTALSPDFYANLYQQLLSGGNLERILTALEPDQIGYREIKKAIPAFLEHATYREYTKVPAPKKSDPALFKALLQKRLFEENYIGFDSIPADSVALAHAVKKFQQEKGLAVDGVAGEGTVRMLNTTDKEKFIRIALSLDKYKQLPEKMPSKYVWVNVPAYTMDVVENDSVKFSSKVIIGKPKTQTPLLNGALSVLITYPQWVPPPSIVKKEILPAVRKNPDYLAKKGFTLVDSNGEAVDPYTIDWSKYSYMPYRVVQGSGDANALGIMKFHFDNKYSVYLHDTNQRYLFANAMRSLSHGCVRVQEWEKLTWYLLRNDSLAGARGNRTDSVKTWLANKQKRSLALRSKVPVYIRYITCEGRNGEVVFHDDPYGTDQLLRERYFARK